MWLLATSADRDAVAAAPRARKILAGLPEPML